MREGARISAVHRGGTSLRMLSSHQSGEVADAARAARDREPGLGADDGGSRILVLAAVLHRTRFDPLERRLAARERDELRCIQ